jgi:hypothetical protein
VFFTPAWGQWQCGGCASILGINMRRRLLGVLPLCAVFILVPILIGGAENVTIAGILFAWGLVFHFLFFERVRLIEGTGFRCRQCGYDLRGLADNRCPECGCEFDAGHPNFAAADIHSEPPSASRPKSRLALTLLIVLPLVALQVLGIVYLKRTRVRAARRPVVTAKQAAPGTNTPPEDEGTANAEQSTTAPSSEREINNNLEQP